MILLDTHIWIWWISERDKLEDSILQTLDGASPGALKISAISVWELAKLCEKGRVEFTIPVADWIKNSIKSSGIEIIPLTIPIILDSTSLPGNFHQDPCDQIIVATSRVLGFPLIAKDAKIIRYEFVEKVN